MKTALIVVDLQNDYFKGGDWELVGTEAAAKKAGELLDFARENDMLVVHIRHEFTTTEAPFFRPNSKGAEIHSSVANLENEPVVLKHFINSFRETNLKEILDAQNIERVLVCGAMSHMCIGGITRAANDFGYKCTVAHDACATLDLEFNDVKVPAKYVHAAFMASLAFAYADVKSTKEVIATL